MNRYFVFFPFLVMTSSLRFIQASETIIQKALATNHVSICIAMKIFFLDVPIAKLYTEGQLNQKALRRIMRTPLDSNLTKTPVISEGLKNTDLEIRTRFQVLERQLKSCYAKAHEKQFIDADSCEALAAKLLETLDQPATQP